MSPGRQRRSNACDTCAKTAASTAAAPLDCSHVTTQQPHNVHCWGKDEEQGSRQQTHNDTLRAEKNGDSTSWYLVLRRPSNSLLLCSVELLLHGNAAQVDLVLQELWIGPPASAVSNVRVEPSLPFDEGGAVDLTSFVRRPDA